MAGFSSVEALLAAAIFALLVTALAGIYLYGEEAVGLAGNRTRATMLAEEGLEAIRNLRDAGFSNLIDGPHGLIVSGNQWNFSGSSDASGIFTRQIIISTVDANRKNIVSNVTWQQNPQRSGAVSLATRLTNWSRSVSSPPSCNGLAQAQGYASGVCRQNANQCVNNGQIYLAAGDALCAGGPQVDTCCATP